MQADTEAGNDFHGSGARALCRSWERSTILASPTYSTCWRFDSGPGRLSVVANGDEVSLYIEHGKMVLVTSSNMALRLGRMLVRLEFLTNDRLREALRLQEQMSGRRPLGSILIDGGFISEAQLHQCIEEQCIEVLARIIAAESGIFVFHGESRARRGRRSCRSIRIASCSRQRDAPTRSPGCAPCCRTSWRR